MDRLTCNQFSVFYGKKTVVDNVTFSIEPGQLVALLGPNGCGKTTLMKGICGLARSQGQCLLQGEDFLSLSPSEKSRRLAYIPQRTTMTFSISVLDMVLMGFHSRLGLFEHYQTNQKEKAMEALSWMGLSHRAQEDFLTLSEGQKQLVILARAMVQETDFFLFDEPDSAMDFSNKHLVLGKIQSMVAQNKAGLLCLHDANFALQYCTRALLMKDGHLVGDLDLRNDSQDTLTQGLSLLYGEIQLLPTEKSYVMTLR